MATYTHRALLFKANAAGSQPPDPGGGRHASRLALMLVLSLAVLPDVPNASASETDAGRLALTVDVHALRESFSTNGSFVLPFPHLGPITIGGNPVELFAAGLQWAWADMDSSGSIVQYGEIGLSIDGWVEEYPSSRASVYVGDHGVYGSIDIEDANGTVTHYQLDVIDEGSQGWQQIINATRSVDPNDVMSWPPAPVETASAMVPPSTCSGGGGTSIVQMDVEGPLKARHANWADRAISAFSHYKSTWDEMCIFLTLNTVRGFDYTILTSTTCGTDEGTDAAREEYLLFLQQEVHQAHGVDAYQLWTDLALDGCLGVAAPQTSGTGPNSNKAASVVVGYDHYWYDGYDPDESEERGAVSAHEFAHVYGEEHHRDACEGYWNCNIMWDGRDVDRNAFWFTAESKTEITQWFHYGLDPVT